MENAIQLYFISLFYNLNAVSFFRSLIFLKLFFFFYKYELPSYLQEGNLIYNQILANHLKDN